ncbi:hypothetical protein GCM10027299_42300 [Larkinella ripae]
MSKPLIYTYIIRKLKLHRLVKQKSLMTMKDSRLEIKISSKHKLAFAAACEERGISVSDAVRELIAKSVRNYKNGRDKTAGVEK